MSVCEPQWTHLWSERHGQCAAQDRIPAQPLKPLVGLDVLCTPSQAPDALGLVCRQQPSHQVLRVNVEVSARGGGGAVAA